MDKIDFSISFVGVWERPLSVLPSFDNRFAKDLFGQPYETFNGLTPEGYVIAIENKPFPMVTLSPNRLIIKAKDSESLQKYLDVIKPVLDKMIPYTCFAAFGINSEFQWTDIDGSPETWLWNHFINPSISSPSSVQMCNKLNLRIGIDETQLANVEIEPRRGIRDGIFVNINHHHNQSLSGIPTGTDVKILIEKSLNIIEEFVVRPLIENE